MSLPETVISHALVELQELFTASHPPVGRNTPARVCRPPGLGRIHPRMGGHCSCFAEDAAAAVVEGVHGT